jgi:hypothetical protein
MEIILVYLVTIIRNARARDAVTAPRAEIFTFY